MSRPTRYALIPTHNRLEQLAALVRTLAAQGCDHVVVIDNASDPRVSKLWLKVETGVRAVTVVHDDEQPPNLYRLWNRGFQLIELTARIMREETWDVVVLNDDAELPDGWLDYVAAGIRQTGPAAVVCTDPYGTLQAPLLKTQPDANIHTRMCPWAFVVRGELGLRADESLRWWWGDTDFDWQACGAGGVLLLPGYTTKNTGANSSTHGELAEQAGRDGQTFAAKWGWRPW
jgi:glycosyltransferase involved in cell wall biosynthesis